MRRLKILEQLLIVFFTAVLLPLFVAGLIVTNVNQHAVREEIRYSANITADNVYQRLLSSIEKRKLLTLYIAKGLRNVKSEDKLRKVLKDISGYSDEISKIELISSGNKAKETYSPIFKNSIIDIHPDINSNKLIIYASLNNNNYIKEYVDLKKLQDDVFKNIVNEKRPVYIIDSKNNIIMSHNPNSGAFKKAIPYLPKVQEARKPVVFGRYKNQPNVFLKLQDPEWSIIVLTPANLTNYGIIKARYKILNALIVAAIATIIIGVWYSVSLNTNIRQLLKAISAISKGNYRKRVRLLRDYFTPYEIVFLANEFNSMVQKIEDSYIEMQVANEQLSRLDEMKSNLIDTVSHEFRTPLTCIKGYTSSLLRTDITIDEETRIKSLKRIKEQTERLGRLVEDLLVIPDIESSMIRLFPDEVDLKGLFESCIMSIQQKQSRKINFSINENMPVIIADPDRVEQVIINLLDNAVKYSPENSEININVYKEDNMAVIKIQNECDFIPDNVLKTLFGKFTRLDENLTRTTRGTGLGLFIAKGLVEAMQGTIALSAKNGFEVCVNLPLDI